MASRMFSPVLGCVEKGVVFLYAQFEGNGSTGVLNASGKGVAGIARVSAGKYRVTLQDAYQKVLAVNAQITQDPSSSPVAGVGALRVSVLNSVEEPAPVNSSKTFDVLVVNASDAATDLPVNSGLLLAITLSNTSVY